MAHAILPSQVAVKAEYNFPSQTSVTSYSKENPDSLLFCLRRTEDSEQ